MYDNNKNNEYEFSTVQLISTNIERESPSKLLLGEPSGATFATNLELNRASLELIIVSLRFEMRGLKTAHRSLEPSAVLGISL